MNSRASEPYREGRHTFVSTTSSQGHRGVIWVVFGGGQWCSADLWRVAVARARLVSVLVGLGLIAGSQAVTVASAGAAPAPVVEPAAAPAAAAGPVTPTPPPVPPTPVVGPAVVDPVAPLTGLDRGRWWSRRRSMTLTPMSTSILREVFARSVGRRCRWVV